MSFFWIVSNQGGVYLEIEAKGTRAEPGTPLQVVVTQTKSDFQQWELHQPDANVQAEYQGYWYLRSKAKKDNKPLVIAIKGGGNKPGTTVDVDTQHAISGEPVGFDQVWAFIPGPADYFFILSLGAQLVIEIKGGKQGKASVVVNSQKSNNNDYQLWKFVDEKGKSLKVPAPPQQGGGWPVPPGGPSHPDPHE
jgi:hypothetical protein